MDSLPGMIRDWVHFTNIKKKHREFHLFWGREIGWMVHFGVHSFGSCFENFEASPDDAKWLIFIPKIRHGS